MVNAIAIASDHAGFPLKEEVREVLEHRGLKVQDCGTDSEASVDYPDLGKKAVEAVLAGGVQSAVLVCGTGIGMSIVANRYPGIRAALVQDAETAAMAKRHNNANVLVLPGWKLGSLRLGEILGAWLDTDFEGGRHQRRLDKIDSTGRK